MVPACMTCHAAGMRPWMLEAPMAKLPESAVAAFADAWATRDLNRLPGGMPRWLFLRWLERQGCLLHGSQQSDISEFEPRSPHDLSPDEFSKRPGVFASSDALWALMYALRDRTRVTRMLNMALQIHDGAPVVGHAVFPVVRAP